MSVETTDPTRLPEGAVESLRCPRCRSRVEFGDDVVNCSAGCGASFPVYDGIPILINEANSVFTLAEFAPGRATFFPDKPAAVRLMDKVLPDISRNVDSSAHYARFVTELHARSAHPRVLVIGGGVVGTDMETLLDDPSIDLVESDVTLERRTALVCDAHDLPFADGTFDGVVVQAVLEHVADPARCVTEIHRVLGPRGVVYAETPFMQQVHGGRYDFTRFSLLGHRRLFRDFGEISSGAVCGPGMALAWSLTYFLLSFARGAAARKVLRGISRILFWPLPLLDPFLLTRPAALDAASGVYFLGERATAPMSDRELISHYRGGMR